MARFNLKALAAEIAAQARINAVDMIHEYRRVLPVGTDLQSRFGLEAQLNTAEAWIEAPQSYSLFERPFTRKQEAALYKYFRKALNYAGISGMSVRAADDAEYARLQAMKSGPAVKQNTSNEEKEEKRWYAAVEATILMQSIGVSPAQLAVGRAAEAIDTLEKQIVNDARTLAMRCNDYANSIEIDSGSRVLLASYSNPIDDGLVRDLARNQVRLEEKCEALLSLISASFGSAITERFTECLKRFANRTVGPRTRS